MVFYVRLNFLNIFIKFSNKSDGQTFYTDSHSCTYFIREIVLKKEKKLEAAKKAEVGGGGGEDQRRAALRPALSGGAHFQLHGGYSGNHPLGRC